MHKLKQLIGTWVGSGIAKYPTINTVEYSEILIFSTNNHDDVLHYEQKTWTLDEKTKIKKPIFWECGFIVSKADEIILVNSQKSGRIENMTVDIEELKTGALKMTATTKDFLNDPRMISSKRIFNILEEKIEYELYMKTTLTELDSESELHLKATLIKEKH